MAYGTYSSIKTAVTAGVIAAMSRSGGRKSAPARSKGKGRYVTTSKNKGKRRAGSTTKYQKKKPKKQLGSSQHSGLNYSRKTVIINYKKPKTKGKPVVLTETYSTNVLAAAGLQNVQTIVAGGTLSQWNTSTGTGWTPTQAHLAYNGMDFSGTIPNVGAVFTSPTNVNQRLVLTTTEIDIVVTSQCNIESFGNLFIVKYMKDSDDDPSSLMVLGLTNQSGGVAEVSAPGGGALVSETGRPAFNMPFIRPGDTTFFNKYAKIVSTIPMNLAAGASKKVSLNIVHNYAYNGGIMDEMAALGVTNPKGCYHIFYIGHGAVVFDGAASSSGAHTLATLDLGLVVSKRSHFYQSPQSNSATKKNIGVWNIPTSLAIADQDFINTQDVVDTIKTA